jgi:hypothetical protein
MIIFMLGLVVIAILGNMAYYESRVYKGLFKEPKSISEAYSKLLLHKRYK